MSYTGIPGLSKGKAPREVKEEDLLNDIEASTKRLYQQVGMPSTFVDIARVEDAIFPYAY